MKAEKYYRRVIELIPEGRENAIHMKELAILLEVDERFIRHAISDARKSGVLVLSNDCDGYFFSNNEEDLKTFCYLTNAKIESMKKAVAPAQRKLREIREGKKEGESSHAGK